MSETVFIYLDESGDLGFRFENQYRNGGSSRYLTIAYIIVPENKKKYTERIVKDIYNQAKISPQQELKGSQFTKQQKQFLGKEIAKLLANNPDIILGSITVNKQKVKQHIQKDPNMLYNYMIKLAFIDDVKQAKLINLIRDNKSTKIKSGNSLADYLQIQLTFELNSEAILKDIPSESHKVKNLLFIDWFTHIIWKEYEDGVKIFSNELHQKLKKKELFF